MSQSKIKQNTEDRSRMTEDRGWAMNAEPRTLNAELRTMNGLCENDEQIYRIYE